jgi:hypothetical protein
MRDPLFSHLPTQARELADWAKRERGDLADALHPRPKAKPPNPQRESLLRGLRELNARIDARLAREGRR